MDFAAFGDTAPGVRRMDMAALEAMGRRGDSELAHVTPGEIVVPVRVAQDPQFKQDLLRAFGDAGMDPSRYVVGDGNRQGQFHPRTGFQEFWGGEGPGNDGTGGDDTGPGDSGGDSGGHDPSAGDDNFGGEDPSGHDSGGNDAHGVSGPTGAPGDPGFGGTAGFGGGSAGVGATAEAPGASVGSFGGETDFGESGFFSDPLGFLGKQLSNPLGMMSMVPGPIGAIAGLANFAQTTGVFSDKDGDGFVDDGPFAGLSISHDPADTSGNMGDVGEDGSEDPLDQVAREMGWDNVPSQAGGSGKGNLSYKPGELPTRQRRRYHAPTAYEQVVFAPAAAWQEQQRAPQYRSYRGN